MGQCRVEFKVPLTIKCNFMVNRPDLDELDMVLCIKYNERVTHELCACCQEPGREVAVEENEAEVS
ncbi:MAG: hypothetical protein M0P69_09930 [Bacteroidales bacterium]|nr:hypothetical protein [Bacteroidales bacterium]